MTPVFLGRHNQSTTSKGIFLSPKLWIRKDGEGKEPWFYPFFTILQLFLQVTLYSFLPFHSCFGWICSFWLLLQLILYTVICHLVQTSQNSAETCAPLKSGTQKWLPSDWNAKSCSLWNGRNFCHGLQGNKCVASKTLVIGWATVMKKPCLHKLWTVLVFV